MSDISRDYSFGGWIRHLRVQRELTLRDASKRLGMDPGNLSKLERSELAPPKTAKRVRTICKKLGFTGSEDLLVSVAFQHHVSALKARFESQET